MILFFHFICIWVHYLVFSISKSLRKSKVLNDKQGDDFIESQSSPYIVLRTEDTKFPVYENGTLKFSPPVFVQRYEAVFLILKEYALTRNIKKVADFGCAELGFLMYLKNIKGVTEILEVDIDPTVLEKNSFKAAPLTSDYLMGKRSSPLHIYILAGNIADYDDYLIGCDTVIGIEIIEHLTEEALNKMPYIVFNKIKPNLAIFTTPNADFNSLFPNFTDFRHKDHKFEWTRKEFLNWAQEILNLYPDYSVKFYGIGIGPEGSENLGCCTQMAVFQRLENAEFLSSSRKETERFHMYKLINHYEYPFYVDPRTTEEKIVHEIQYQINYLSKIDTFYNYDSNESEIPLNLLREYVSDLCTDSEKIFNILEKYGMTFRQKDNSWFLVHTEAESNLSEITFKCDDWLNEEELDNFSNYDEGIFEEKWSDEEHIPTENATESQSARSLIKKLRSDLTDNKGFFYNTERDCLTVSESKKESVSLSCKHLADSSMLYSNHDVKKMNSVKSRIPIKRNKNFRGSLVSVRGIGQPFKEIFKSCSLDSCLENVNDKFFEEEGYYLDLIPGGSLYFRHRSSLSSYQKKFMTSSSESSLLSINLDKATDDGYPFSVSLLNKDLTSE